MNVKIPREIKEINSDVFMGLNLRQTLCVIAAILINISIYIYGSYYLNIDRIILSYVSITITIPFGLIGFFKYNGLTFLQFIKLLFIRVFKNKKIRKYRGVNIEETKNK